MDALTRRDTVPPPLPKEPPPKWSTTAVAGTTGLVRTTALRPLIVPTEEERAIQPPRNATALETAGPGRSAFTSTQAAGDNPYLLMEAPRQEETLPPYRLAGSPHPNAFRGTSVDGKTFRTAGIRRLAASTTHGGARKKVSSTVQETMI